MDIGDIFVNYQNEFDVGIENTGEIDCHWKLVPYETPFGSKFHFSKTEGVLGVKVSLQNYWRNWRMTPMNGLLRAHFKTQ